MHRIFPKTFVIEIPFSNMVYIQDMIFTTEVHVMYCHFIVKKTIFIMKMSEWFFDGTFGNSYCCSFFCLNSEGYEYSNYMVYIFLPTYLI